MSTAVTAPSSFTQAGTAGLTYAYKLQESLELALMDSLGDAVIQFAGEPLDLTAMGSDTKRMGVLSNVGFQKAFTASGGEATINAASGYTLDYWEGSVGQYDLSFTQTVKSAVLGLPGVTVTLEDLAKFLPMNVLATMRSLFCTAGSGFSATTVGSASANLDADDIYDLAAAATRKLGAGALGMPTAFLDPEQFLTARDAFRSEPAWIQNIAAMQQVQKIQAGQDLGDVFGLGFNVMITDSIVQSGGAYRGFCGSPGSIRRLVADPSRAMLPTGVNPRYLPMGVVIYDLLQALNSATYGWQALMFAGMAQGSATSSLQIRVTSVV